MATSRQIAKQAQIQAVIADFAMGMSKMAIAKKHGVSRQTITAWLKDIQRGETINDTDSYELKTVKAYRSVLEHKSVQALHDALVDGRDNYKRAGVARDVLKGIGVFSGDTPNTQVNVLMQSVPSEWHERYASGIGNKSATSPIPTIDITSDTKHLAE